MTDSSEIDPETLQQEVAQIKDAMGLQERYPGRFWYWIIFGLAVFVASVGSQVIALRDLSPTLHAVVWGVPLGGVGAYQWWDTRGQTSSGVSSTATKPRIGVLWLSVFALVVVVLLTVLPAAEGTGEESTEILLFSLIVGFVGVGYLVVGEALRAYYIRRRDRWAFYIGGVWMLVLAVLMPTVELLETWGYLTFGVAYVGHATVSYLTLR